MSTTIRTMTLHGLAALALAAMAARSTARRARFPTDRLCRCHH